MAPTEMSSAAMTLGVIIAGGVGLAAGWFLGVRRRRAAANDGAAISSAERVLRESQRRLEAAFESIPTAAAIVSRDGRVAAVNRVWREAQQSPGWPAPEIHEGDVVSPETHGMLAGPARGGPPAKAATWRIEGVAPADAAAGLVVLRAEREASGGADRELLTTIVDSTAALITATDREGRLLLFNRACASLTGLTPAEVMARPYWETVMPPEERARAAAEHARMFSTGDARPLESVWMGRDGQRHQILWTSTVHRGAGGAPERVISTGVDVTETRRMQGELVQAQRMEAIGQLAGGIAHDFNNLLTAIFGHTAIAKRLIPADHEAFASLERVDQAAEQAGRVIRSLLTFSRTERSDKAPLQLAALLQDTAALIRGLLPAQVELRTTPPPASMWIEADRLQIQQAILNLAINARDAMPSGGVLRITVHPAEGEKAAIEVEDSGRGIPKELLPRIFEPFYTTKTKSTGGGLGLPVARSIAADHGGSLTIASEPGVGTRATLTLPLTPCPEPAAAPLAPGRELRLLVASTRTYPRRIMISALSSLGPPVLGLSSAEQLAAELSAAAPGDIVVCDASILAEDANLLGAALTRGVPTVILGDTAVLADLSAQGAAILAEPFTTSQLIQAVRRVADMGAGEPRGAPPAGPTYSR